MKIERLEVGFTSIVDIGRCAYFIYTRKDGVFVKIDELVENAKGFYRVVLLGEDPLLQREDVAKLCKSLVKANPMIKIEIHTNGLHKPTEMNSYMHNTQFNVFVNIKKDKNYKLDEAVLSWFNDAGANFIFKVDNEKDMDEAAFIGNSIGIKKSQILLSPTNTIPTLLRQAKFYGFNLAPIVEWEE